ncbi:MAG: DUF2380 domain-containing protein, partial [Pseudonocardiaceae bacterium]
VRRLPPGPEPRGQITARPKGGLSEAERDVAARRGVHIGPAYVDFHEHHLLPKAKNFRTWFAEPPRNLDVDDFVVRLDVATHEATHMAGWSDDWFEFMTGKQTATAVEVLAFKDQLKIKYKIAGLPEFRYTKAPKKP